MPSPSNFYSEQREQSLVKATMVAKYFDAWFNIIANRVEWCAYADLFSGPGRYKDGNASTPLLVIQKALDNDKLADRLITIFNDANPSLADALRENIAQLPGVSHLGRKPIVLSENVSTGFAFRHGIDSMPVLLFADPWGYAGLTQHLVAEFLSSWGSDCILFFNYNRINQSLEIDSVAGHIERLFGYSRAVSLRKSVAGLGPDDRECRIIEALFDALVEVGGDYVLPFRFVSDSGDRTSHYIVFVSKHHRGYGVMKEIMAAESSSNNQGVASFEYCAADIECPRLFQLSRPLSELGNQLLGKFSGRTLNREQIYDEHNVGTPFIESNYRQALLSLEDEGLVTCSPPANARRRYQGGPSLSRTVQITFP